MPEGDTIHNAARRVGAALVGKPIETIETPQRRHAHGPLARAPARARGPLGGRPRQAPVPALRGRPHPPLPPPHGRRLVGLPPRPALAAQPAPRLARDPHAGARGGAVRRTGAGADDRLAHPLRPAAREPRPGPAGGQPSTSGAFLRRLREDDQSRGIADALLDQRNGRRHRQPLEGRGLLPRGREPVAAAERGARTSWPSRSSPASARSCRRPPRAASSSATRGSSSATAARAGAAARIIKARGQGDDNRTTYWCPACQT